MPLTLEKFRNTRQGPFPDIRMEFGDAEEPIRGYIYENGCICLTEKDEPYLVIENQTWIESLGKLEEILYERWYLPLTQN